MALTSGGSGPPGEEVECDEVEWGGRSERVLLLVFRSISSIP